jgi:hypothetical protein
MQFKPDDALKQMTGIISAEVKPKARAATPESDLPSSEQQLDLMKARRGIDLSEMILGR